jgi:hypothetical protein
MEWGQPEDPDAEALISRSNGEITQKITRIFPQLESSDILPALRRDHADVSIPPSVPIANLKGGFRCIVNSVGFWV